MQREEFISQRIYVVLRFSKGLPEADARKVVARKLKGYGSRASHFLELHVFSESKHKQMPLD